MQLYDSAQGTSSNLTKENHVQNMKLQRLIKSSSSIFPANTHYKNIMYAEVKELYHPPEHLLPMIPEESPIEIDSIAAAALSSIEGFFPEDIVAIVEELPRLSLKVRKTAATYSLDQPTKTKQSKDMNKIVSQTFSTYLMSTTMLNIIGKLKVGIVEHQ